MKPKFIAVVVVALTIGCSAKQAPPSLSPAGVKIWQANQALLILDTVQHSAIGLNRIEQCDTATPAVCKPLLSDANTKVVVDAVADGVNTIRAVPTGWKATTNAALKIIATRLDAAGQKTLAAYITAGQEILNSIVV